MNSIAPSTSESARSWLQAAYLANHGDTSQTSSSSATATAALQNTVSVPHATTTQSVIVPGSSGSTSSVYSTMAACAMYYDGNSSSFPFMAPTVTQSAASNDGAGTVYTKFTQRFIGSANIATDMKEASFFGPNGEYIVSGSDDGHLFIWDRYTGEVLLCRAADPDLLSCVQVRKQIVLIKYFFSLCGPLT
jgi:WD40 repeat protein